MSKLNIEIKLAFGFLAVTVLIPLAVLIFGLLPIYGLVGKGAISGTSSQNQDSHVDAVLHRSQLLVGILLPLATLAFVAFIVLLVLGLRKAGSIRER